jgi:hypothetical protein
MSSYPRLSNRVKSGYIVSLCPMLPDWLIGDIGQLAVSGLGCQVVCDSLYTGPYMLFYVVIMLFVPVTTHGRLGECCKCTVCRTLTPPSVMRSKVEGHKPNNRCVTCMRTPNNNK